MEFTQYTENEKAELVLIHEPSYEIFMSMLHPAASLYADVTSQEEVKSIFFELKKILNSLDIKLMSVRDCLKLNKEALINLAKDALTYEVANANEGKENPDFLYYISDEYKISVLNKLAEDQLVDVVLTRPTYVMKYVSVNTYVEPVEIRFRPLGNLLFARDQQITTQKGVVIGRTMTWAREMEHNLMIQVFKNLNVKVIGEVPEEAYIEGGDFYVLKHDLSVLGVGMRTNIKAAGYLMENDLIGTNRFALIIDDNDFTQQRMHLDTFFNILDENHVICLDFDDLTQYYGRKINRKVHIYSKAKEDKNMDKNVENSSFGEYNLIQKFDDFYSFLEYEKLYYVKISHEHQSDFMINFLNVGNGTIISVNKELKDLVDKANINVDVKIIDIKFDAIIKMFGAVHCTTQVSRKRRDILNTK